MNITPHKYQNHEYEDCSTYFVILQNDVTVCYSHACAATVFTNDPNLCIVCKIQQITL